MVCSYRCPSLNSERRASIVALADWLPMRKDEAKKRGLDFALARSLSLWCRASRSSLVEPEDAVCLFGWRTQKNMGSRELLWRQSVQNF